MQHELPREKDVFTPQAEAQPGEVPTGGSTASSAPVSKRPIEEDEQQLGEKELADIRKGALGPEAGLSPGKLAEAANKLGDGIHTAKRAKNDG